MTYLSVAKLFPVKHNPHSALSEILSKKQTLEEAKLSVSLVHRDIASTERRIIPSNHIWHQRNLSFCRTETLNFTQAAFYKENHSNTLKRYASGMRRYTLIITEKPDAAQRIASALDSQEKARKIVDNGVPYYLAKSDREIVVVPSLGHLFTVAEGRNRRDYYPAFGFKWVPRHVAEKESKRTRMWIQTIAKLAKDANVFIDACDYDVEGSVIGYCILKYVCGHRERTSRRMKYSTLTREELRESYTETLPRLDFALVEAGRTRHEVDWLYGVNLSRALTVAARNWSGKYTTISTGRVQGPTLKFLVAREKSIRTFVPTPYWEIKAQLRIGSRIFEAKHEKEIVETRKEAETILNACKNKNGQVAKIGIKQFQQSPPFPFDLGSLQSEAYRLFGYTPRRTLNIAQRLYLNALISYPRTDSQKLPPEIDYQAILKKLNKAQEYRKLTMELLAKPELKPNEGNKDDPAHPAIYPTGSPSDRVLEGFEANILDLIVRRFMAVFDDPAVRQNIRVYIDINGQDFYLSGRRTLVGGWLRFYGPYARSDEVPLPPMKKGQPIKISRIIVENKFTGPPSRYNPSSLLRKMEATGIGTKATRADIVETLHDRKYVQDERMVVTDLGFDVLEILKNHCPTVISTRLTKELEERMIRVHEHSLKREDVLIGAVRILKPVLEKLKEREKIVGEQLSNAIRRARSEERTIGACPICGTGRLVILRSSKTGKRFIGCTSYFKGSCKTSFSLPQNGTVRRRVKKCGACAWPTVQVRARGRRPWILCLNPACPLKQERSRRIEMRNM